MRNQEREDAWDKRLLSIGGWIEELSNGKGCKRLVGGELTGITIRFPTEDRPETLLVLKASTGGERYVSFCGALELGDAILVWRAKERAKGAKWRVDIPWGQRSE